ncbi:MULTISPECIES: lysine--tRNA ligase [Candidatus Ichthyocystis]|uniref:Lysine--tRNA ligase n=1 Tax=Candidatus Ichthyocystis hellenicum TaxID=1561003 RepID=A0A0S4M201_9BURK|nr:MULTISPECIES: lysine--tRNA ligase [Ichthyocystis]CUT17799.1 Lysine--tRNA synthase [Candidatus Ichthyocystis hellenicum]
MAEYTKVDDVDTSHIVRERFEKLSLMRQQGVAYKNNFRPQDKADHLIKLYQHVTDSELSCREIFVTIAGRIVLKRLMGKASFATLQDCTGKIQIYLSEKNIDPSVCDNFKTWDLGDICYVEGTIFHTKTGELTVKVTNIELVSKCLRPLPDKFHGLVDQDKRYRQRYVDLIVNEETRRVFLNRSKTISSVRHMLESHDFLEVETPMMHPIPGGAVAKPFVTHHHALDRDLFLRVAPELYLKRLLVGGFDRVFEINRSFRNEGISPRHNPEFTMLEMYAAYSDYIWMMDFTEKLIRQVAIDILGTAVFTYQGREIDISTKFRRLSMLEAIKEHASYTDDQLADSRFIVEQLESFGVKKDLLTCQGSLSSLHVFLFESVAENKLWQPTFIVDYPTEISPLSRASDDNKNVAERFELFVAGRELANGFSELNDPEDQAARFQQQVIQKNAGNEEAMYYDADYIQALEYGMPPAGGCGVGIDRLVMLLTNTSTIRDVIFFPHLKGG